ncbi:MAG: DHA2 family efflux MFS transporter permease subunit [Sphingomonadales bacterium]|nr:DHA2 family efflux MFS transporter permease subunit [Sphingomonadales bacterium]
MSAARGTALAAQAADLPLLPTRNRPLLLAAVMMVSMCQFFDATIANVALPHMRAALGASPESISWVLTSFIIATAIATPITGWLSDRIGSRELFIGSTVLFLVSSAACGAATSLSAMVVFRSVQGVAAAFIGPLTQTIMFDISPPSKQASTMSGFGMLVMVAPISGPFVGAFLTDSLNWRWIYYVNLPIGIPALVLLWWLLPSRPIEKRPLDRFGFATLALGLAALQLLLDRGQHNDWWESTETWAEALVLGCAAWLFFVHTRFTGRPLFSPRLVRAPNFLVGCGAMTVLGISNVALSSILPTMYQTVFRFPVVFSGLLMAPRGFGVILMTVVTNRLMKRFDHRVLISIGYLVVSASMWIMTTWTIDMDWHRIVLASFVQGMGLGLVFTPMNMIAFGSLPPDLRPDGASVLGLFRSIGGSVGISAIVTMLAGNQQVNHADMAAHVTALSDLSAVSGGRLSADSTLPVLDGMISAQSAMIAYLDNFTLIAWMMAAVALLPFLLKKPRTGEFGAAHHGAAAE